MRMWLRTQRLLWRRMLSQPQSIGTIKLTPDFMVRDIGLATLRIGAASMAVRRYLHAYETTLPLHTKRSPRPDDLRRLLNQGQELQRRDDSAVTQRLLLQPLTKLADLLGERELLLTLFETAMERRYRLSARELTILTDACTVLLKHHHPTDAPGLAERADALRQQVVALDPTLPGPVQTGLLAAGNGALGQLDELRLIPPADRTPVEWGLLIGLLLKRAESAEDMLLEAIAAVDQALPLLSSGEAHTPEGNGPRLLMWLAIVAAAREQFAIARGLDTAAVARALAQAAHLDTRVLRPHHLFQEMVAAAPGGQRGGYALCWSVLSIDLLWSVDFAGGADLRRAVLDMAIESAAAGQMERLDTSAAGLEFFRRLQLSEAMWLDEATRRDILRRSEHILNLVKEPRRSILRGHCHLAQDEEEAAEAIFAGHRGPTAATQFNGAGHVTFLRATEAAAQLDDPVLDPRFLPETCDFRMEKRVEFPKRLLVAVACGDPAYVNRYFRRYAQSYFRTDRRSVFLLHVLGSTDALDEDIRRVVAGHPRIMLSSERPPVEMPYYYATARFLRAPVFQRELQASLMLTDLDITFRTSAGQSYRRWSKAGDVGLRLYDKVRWFPRTDMIGYKTPRLETWGSINASCVYLARSEPSRGFAVGLSQVAQHALSKFHENGNSNWWIDQNVLYASLRPLSERVKGLRLFNLLETGIPFGAYQGNLEGMPPPAGHRPGMPSL